MTISRYGEKSLKVNCVAAVIELCGGSRGRGGGGGRNKK